MPGLKSERVKADTAEKLFNSHPGLNALLTCTGMIEVAPTPKTGEPFIDFKTLLYLGSYRGKKHGSGLVFSSWLPNGQPSTRWRVPSSESWDEDNVELTLDGEIARNAILAAALGGVEMLTDYRGLSSTEQELFDRTYGDSGKVRNELTRPEPKLIHNELVAPPDGYITYGTFVVAQRVLLEI